MESISDKDFEKFVCNMASKLDFRMSIINKPIWTCGHDPSFPMTVLVLREDLGYIPARIAFVIESCRKAGIQCDCALMFNLDKI